MWHEHSVRNNLKPSERKGRILVWVKLSHQVSDVKKNLALRLLVETVADVYRSKNVHNHAEVRFLVEAVGLSFRVSFLLK
jgi:uncharacterized protein (UPF0276 family)